MSDHSGKAHSLAWVLGACAVVGALSGRVLVWRAKATVPAEKTFPLPPFSATKYLNTGAEARYIGTAACAACHAKNHRSYLLTPHSRAFADLDPKSEPPDGSFFHKPSGRSLRVYRKDGQLRQEDILRTPQGEEIARMDMPLRYLVGSGNFTRTYLVEVDGFLHEAPVTWYSGKKKWAMSPGYDSPQRWSFDRPVLLRCLSCHAGRVEDGGGDDRLKLLEKTIGCESCHGPGSLHQEHQRSGKHTRTEEDLTIVHPGRLSRPLLESICASCHMSGPATVVLRGRTLTDFRPGRPLTDYRIDYRFDSGNEQMTVVGHVEQLRQSACYQKSEGLTCLTCHDPHAREKPTDKVAFFRGKCLNCHTSKPCGLPKAQRLEKDARDNCLVCHMPVGDTDIPHIAFTHHRIGRPASRSTVDSDRVPLLVPTDTVELSPLDVDRNLGLAYRAAYRNPDTPQLAAAFADRARDLLEKVDAAGLVEAAPLEALAEIYYTFKKNPHRTIRYARKALEVKGIPSEVRARALSYLAESEMSEGNFESAIAALEELVLLRRTAHDWRHLGQCYLEVGQPKKALPALQRALSIRPFRPLIHRSLDDTYRQLGDTKCAEEHRIKAEWLERLNQD